MSQAGVALNIIAPAFLPAECATLEDTSDVASGVGPFLISPGPV
jgi:hypothetical protein